MGRFLIFSGNQRNFKSGEEIWLDSDGTYPHGRAELLCGVFRADGLRNIDREVKRFAETMLFGGDGLNNHRDIIFAKS